MSLSARAALRAVSGLCALLALGGLAGCDGALGEAPPHAAPANPAAEPRDGKVELSWGAVTDAKRYVILWDANTGKPTYENEIDVEGATSYDHTGLTNLVEYHYKVVAETGGGRGPLSLAVSAIPGPVPGGIDWTAVTSQAPGNTIYFPEATNATHYRVYFGAFEAQLAGNRPLAAFERADGPPFFRKDVPLLSMVYYRVFAMNGTRIGEGGPVAITPTRVIQAFDLAKAGVASGRVNDDDCLDLPTALGTVDTNVCSNSLTARVLADVGLGNLIAEPRKLADARFADVNGDGFDDLFSSTGTLATVDGSVALLHVNQGNGNFQSSAAVAAQGIGGLSGTVLAADFDNDGDVDFFVPYDQTQGDGALNRFLVNDGSGGFTERAAAAGLATNPAGAAYVPNGGQAADFDGDGFIDVLFGSRLMRNNGDGTFSDGSTAAHMPVRADLGLKLVDVDNDGDLDLIHHDGTITRLYRNTGGVFDDGAALNASVAAPAKGLASCDFNDDGYEDVFTAGNAETGRTVGTPRIFVNVQGELLRSATQQGTATNTDAFVSFNGALACLDLNRDGMMDVIARWGTSYRVLRSTGTLARRFVLRIVGSGGDRNQQGRVVRIVPQSDPGVVMTRVVDSGSGLRAQNPYDIVIGAPWSGKYDVTVQFADGEVTTEAEAGDKLSISADGTVEDIDRDDEE